VMGEDTVLLEGELKREPRESSFIGVTE
jgi:hypothetical protein